MIDQEPIEPDEQTMVIRPAGPPDAAALEQLATLDGRRLGAAPLLVAECRRRRHARRRSRPSTTAPSSPTRSATPSRPSPQLRTGPCRLGAGVHGGAICARRLLRRLSARQAPIAGHALAAVLIGASTGQAAPRPALPAGTWVGTGTANGTSTDTRRVVAVHRAPPLHLRRRQRRPGPRDGLVREPHDHVGRRSPRRWRRPPTVVFRGTLDRHRLLGHRLDASPIRLGHPHAEADHDPAAAADRAGRSPCKASGGFVLNGLAFHWSAAQEDRRHLPHLIDRPDATPGHRTGAGETRSAAKSRRLDDHDRG